MGMPETTIMDYANSQRKLLPLIGACFVNHACGKNINAMYIQFVEDSKKVCTAPPVWALRITILWNLIYQLCHGNGNAEKFWHLARSSSDVVHFEGAMHEFHGRGNRILSEILRRAWVFRIFCVAPGLRKLRAGSKPLIALDLLIAGFPMRKLYTCIHSKSRSKGLFVGEIQSELHMGRWQWCPLPANGSGPAQGTDGPIHGQSYYCIDTAVHELFRKIGNLPGRKMQRFRTVRVVHRSVWRTFKVCLGHTSIYLLAKIPFALEWIRNFGAVLFCEISEPLNIEPWGAQYSLPKTWWKSLATLPLREMHGTRVLLTWFEQPKPMGS